MPTIIKLHSIDSTLTAVPHLLGFHPAPGSLVLLGIERTAEDDMRVEMTARIDAADLTEAWPQLRTGIQRTHAARTGGFIVIGYDLPDAVVCGVAVILVAEGVRLLDTVIVSGDSWHQPGEHPRETQDDTGVTADMIARHGSAPMSDRAALVATLDPRPAPSEPTARPALTLAHAVAAWSRLLSGSDAALTQRETCEAWESMTFHPFRDAVLVGLGVFPDLATDPGIPAKLVGAVANTEPAVAMNQLTLLATTAPADFAADAYAVLGAYAWSQGDGVRAHVALRHALDADASHKLAQLVTAAVEQGIGPRRTTCAQ